MIIIGDPHGCFKTVLALIKKLPKNERICFVGDLVDRGPDSRKVIDLVIENGYDCVLGNHEAMMQTINTKDEDIWLNNGGLETLKNYYISESDYTLHPDFKKHLEWIETLPLYIEYPNVKNDKGQYLVVSHSNISNVWKHRDFKKMSETKFTDTVLWERNLRVKQGLEIFNIFGHTPQEEPRIRETHAIIDTGCVFKGSPYYGKLTAIQFPEMKIYQQDCID